MEEGNVVKTRSVRNQLKEALFSVSRTEVDDVVNTVVKMAVQNLLKATLNFVWLTAAVNGAISRDARSLLWVVRKTASLMAEENAASMKVVPNLHKAARTYAFRTVEVDDAKQASAQSRLPVAQNTVKFMAVSCLALLTALKGRSRTRFKQQSHL
eukprot:gene12214-biopygen12563